MAIQSDKTLVTKGDLKTLYTDKILPYLGGNMMMQTGVSDYYSTDEKVVGIWINSKPIYQKSFLMTYPEQAIEHNVVDVYLDTGVSIDEVIDIRGTRHSGSEAWTTNIHNSLMAFDAPSAASHLYPYVIDGGIVYVYSNAALDTTRKNKIRLATTQNLEGQTTYITLQYTKTTDTASSALTTPGCYDINRPDLWPNGQEIFFGNGLYGYRKTGTNVTVPKQGRIDIVLITTGNANTKIYNSGGTLENASWKYAIPSSHTTGNGDQFIWFNKNNGSWTNNSIMFYISNNSTTTALNYTNYDVWVTYTK